MTTQWKQNLTDYLSFGDVSSFGDLEQNPDTSGENNAIKKQEE